MGSLWSLLCYKSVSYGLPSLYSSRVCSKHTLCSQAKHAEDNSQHMHPRKGSVQNVNMQQTRSQHSIRWGCFERRTTLLARATYEMKRNLSTVVVACAYFVSIGKQPPHQRTRRATVTQAAQGNKIARNPTKTSCIHTARRLQGL